MKKKLTTALLMLTSILTYSQSVEVRDFAAAKKANSHRNSKYRNYKPDTTIYRDSDIGADFIYGEKPTLKERINDFLLSNLKRPNDDDFIGTVYIRVVVEKDGSLSNLKVERSLDKAFDEEALRVVKLMPKWKPALRRGRIVRSYLLVPVMFRW